MRPTAFLPFGFVAALVLTTASAHSDIVQVQPQATESPKASGPANADGWQIPPGAPEEKNPIPQSEQTIARGKQIYESKCRRCHGPEGRGDGPDADPDHMPEDLSDPSRASRNPDGVMFYKVWNGRKKPKMPAFKTELSREEVWTVIHFAKTLRK
jgi:mono/diheme cytochrome c family protein